MLWGYLILWDLIAGFIGRKFEIWLEYLLVGSWVMFNALKLGEWHWREEADIDKSDYSLRLYTGIWENYFIVFDCCCWK